MRRFVAAGRVGGVPVYVHWTLLIACTLVLLGSLGSVARLASVSFALAAYFAAMLLHEWGHVVLARRRLCQAYAIELYLLVGRTRFQHPRTRLDHCVIAWGG